MLANMQARFLCKQNSCRSVNLLIDLPVLTECPAGSYGHKCLETCKCQNGASCDPVIGTCHCMAGWQGTFCEQGN